MYDLIIKTFSLILMVRKQNPRKKEWNQNKSK